MCLSLCKDGFVENQQVGKEATATPLFGGIAGVGPGFYKSVLTYN